MKRHFGCARWNRVWSWRGPLHLVVTIGPFVVVFAVIVPMASGSGVSAAQTKKSNTASKPATVEATLGDATRGKSIYIKDGCYECHGIEGQGGMGPRLGPDPIPWEAMAEFIRNPPGLKAPYQFIPQSVMPPYTSQLVPDKDVQDIVAYLSTAPTATDIKNIPAYTK